MGKRPDPVEAAQLKWYSGWKGRAGRGAVQSSERQIQIKQREILIGQRRLGGVGTTPRDIKGKPIQQKYKWQRKPRRILTSSQLLKAKSLTPEAQQREYGRIITRIAPKLTKTQIRRAYSFTDKEQMRRYGRVVVVQPKFKSADRIVESTFPSWHPKAGQKVVFKVNIDFLRKIQKSPARIQQSTIQAMIERGTFGGVIDGKVMGTISADDEKNILGKFGLLKSKHREELIKRAALEKQTYSLIPASIALAGVRAVIGAVNVLNPFKIKQTATGAYQAVRHPITTLGAIGREFVIDPIGVVTEFAVYSETLNLAGRLAKRSKVGRYVAEELYIIAQPKPLRPIVRRIIKSAKAQEILNPYKLKEIRKVDFLKVKSITKIEATALKKTLLQTDGVVFGSLPTHTLSKGKTPLPKDVDLAVPVVSQFNQQFIRNLPQKVKRNYLIKGQKIYRVVSSAKQASDKFGVMKYRGRFYDPIFDVKPISRLIPHRSLITRKGEIPVTGYVTKLKAIESLKKINKLIDEINLIKSRLKKTNKKPSIKSFNKKLNLKQKQLKIEKAKFKLSQLPKLTRRAIENALLVPTQKLIKVEGIKMVGFGEQTTRKALGTLQVLIEKNPRRAKDPQSFLIGLEVQLDSLKKSKPKTPIGKFRTNRRIKIISDAIKMLKSKEFSKLLESKVPGLTKEYPLVSKINTLRLKKLNFKKIREKVKERIRTKLIKKYKKIKKETKPSTIKRKIKEKEFINLKEVSKSPSKLPKHLRKSYLPSSLKKSRLPKSRLPPSRIPKSRLPKSRIPKSKIPISRLPPSKIPPSKIPKSKIPISRLPPSRLPPSRIPKSRIPRSRIPTSIRRRKTIPKKTIIKRRFQREEKERKKKFLKKQLHSKFLYLPSLEAKIFGIKAKKGEKRKLLKVGRLFTGTETRKLIRKR